MTRYNRAEDLEVGVDTPKEIALKDFSIHQFDLKVFSPTTIKVEIVLPVPVESQSQIEVQSNNIFMDKCHIGSHSVRIAPNCSRLLFSSSMALGGKLLFYLKDVKNNVVSPHSG